MEEIGIGTIRRRPKVGGARLDLKRLRPWLYRRFGKTYNKATRKRGLKEPGSLLDLFTSGDYVFYADTPGLVKTSHLPGHHMAAGLIVSPMQNVRLPPFQAGSDRLPAFVVSQGSLNLLTRLKLYYS